MDSFVRVVCAAMPARACCVMNRQSGVSVHDSESVSRPARMESPQHISDNVHNMQAWRQRAHGAFGCYDAGFVMSTDLSGIRRSLRPLAYIAPVIVAIAAIRPLSVHMVKDSNKDRSRRRLRPDNWQSPASCTSLASVRLCKTHRGALSCLMVCPVAIDPNKATCIAPGIMHLCGALHCTPASVADPAKQTKCSLSSCGTQRSARTSARMSTSRSQPGSAVCSWPRVRAVR